MSLTVVQRFYELAKQQAEAPAMGHYFGGEYHELPWWFVKSKAKHFGLGLLEEGAQEGEYFYLVASPHPAWAYAELGALTIGLRTLPLPPEISAAKLEELFLRYPPAFFYTDRPDAAGLREALRRRGFRRLIAKEEMDPASASPEPLSFRRIFNAGIRFESKHHAAYRRIRQGLEENREMSPLRVGAFGDLEERPLRFGEVNEVCSKLSHSLGGQRARRLLSASDLSRSFARIACLYWPIFAGIQSVFTAQEHALSPLLRDFRPEAVYLGGTWLREAPPGIDGLSKSEAKLGNWRAFWRRRRLRAKFGGRLRALFFEEVPSASWEYAAAVLGLPRLIASPEAPNFLL